MKPKFILSLVFFLTAVTVLMAGDRNRIDRNIRQQDAFPVLHTAPYNVNVESDIFLQLDPGFSTDSLTLGPEISTGISGYYDYKTNGEANIFIQVDPNDYQNLQAVDVTADSSDFTGLTSRRVKWTYSSNAGQTWETVIEVPDGVRAGYPVLHLSTNGSAILPNHNTNPGGRLDAVLYVDVAPNAGSFTEYFHPLTPAPFGIWPQAAVYGNGNVGIVSRRNVTSSTPPETLFYSYWNQTVLSSRIPIYITGNTFAGNVGSNMRFHIASNGTGRVTVIAAPVNQIDTLNNSKIFARTSTDNGGSWGPVTTVFAPYTENSGADTIATAGGSGFIYKRNSDLWFLAYPVANINDIGVFYSSGRLTMRRSDGVVSTIATATQLGATDTFALTMSFVYSIDFPALGWSADGTTLYCVYSVVMSDVAPSGYNQRDLFCSYSLNDGTTWSNPLRLTNTVNIDETYPSVSSWNRGSGGNPYELNIAYMKDPGVGPASFGGSAPASRNTLIFRKLTGLPPIGINNNQNIVKDYNLAQNYPNPFNPTTKISYNIVKLGLVTLKVYDILGREILTLVNEVQAPGQKNVEFNAVNLPSGVYFYTINSGDFRDTKKMMLVK